MIYSHKIICISMKKHIFVLLSAVLLGGMCGCVQKSSSAQYMTFDTVDYVDGFYFICMLNLKVFLRNIYVNI